MEQRDKSWIGEIVAEVMKAQLRTLVMLLCVGMGHGHWIRTILDERRPAAAESSLRWSPPPSPPRSRRSPLDPPCALRSVLVRVRGLGLGYESDEEVLFKFCSGACPHHRSNHDLALSALLQSGLLPAGGAAAAAAPCCRPTHHEDVAFLDNHHRWHKVEKLSAAACHCVG